MGTTAALDLTVWRNDDVFEMPLRVRGVDLAEVALAMQIRLYRDAPGPALIDLVKVTNGNAEGLRVAGVKVIDGVPVSDVRIRINKSTRQALPYMGEPGDPARFAYALLIGGRTRLIGPVIVLAHAYGSDNAPAVRTGSWGVGGPPALSLGGPLGGATLTIGQDDVVELTIDGADLIGGAVDLAQEGADRAAAAQVAAEEAQAATEALLANAQNRSREVQSERFAAATTDSVDRVIDSIQHDGTNRVAMLQVRTINGRRPAAMTLGQLPFAGGNLTAMTLMLNAGQSLAANHTGGGNMTTSQPGKAVAFPFGVDNPAAVAGTLLPLISTDPAVTGAEVEIRDGEAPMFGMCEYLAELLWKENGLRPADIGLVPVTAQNARGGTAIVENNKGTPRYQRGIAQAGALRTIAQAGGGRARCFGVAWYQGESDVVNGYAYYLQKLRELARDYAADLRAAMPEQPFSPHLVTYQTCQYASGTDPFGVGRAQLQAAIDFASGTVPAGFATVPPVGFSTPIYHMDFRGDPTGVHVKARDAKWLGAYAALYFKRVFVDGRGWPPMAPVVVEREGRALYIRYRLRDQAVRLVVAEGPGFDGQTVPVQPGRGWTAAAAGGGAIALAQAPDVVAPDTIRVVLARAPVNGDQLHYAQTASVKMRPFVGGAGNFRDNYGDLVRYDAINRRMDNWMPAHSIVLDASSGGFQIG